LRARRSCQPVHDERIGRHHDLIALAREHAHEQLDQLVRAVAERQALGRSAELARQALCEQDGSAFRIAVHVRARLAHGGERFGEGPSGFSFDATLMARMPSSRSTSSMGGPACTAPA
jgi:hypothetical protein